MASKKRADYWAPRIHAEWRKSVEGILGVGRQLIAAKEACEHGEFLRLFKGHENAVSDPVPFSERTAERLIAVASHAVISNPTHVSDLPQSWGTLYELTKLDDETLLAGIKAGEITPETTRSQAAALSESRKEKAAPTDDLCVIVNEAFGAVYDKFSSRLDVISRQVVIEHLERLLAKLRHEQSEESSGDETARAVTECQNAEAM